MQIRAAWDSTCDVCGDNIEAGTVIFWDPQDRTRSSHLLCTSQEPEKRKGWKNISKIPCAVCGARLEKGMGERWRCRSRHFFWLTLGGRQECRGSAEHYACRNVEACEEARACQILNEARAQEANLLLEEARSWIQFPKYEAITEVYGEVAPLLGIPRIHIVIEPDQGDRHIWICFPCDDIGKSNVLLQGCPVIGHSLPWSAQREARFRDACEIFTDGARPCPNRNHGTSPPEG